MGLFLDSVENRMENMFELKGQVQERNLAILLRVQGVCLPLGPSSSRVDQGVSGETVCNTEGSHFAHLLSGHVQACLCLGSYFHFCFICKFLKGLGESLSSWLHNVLGKCLHHWSSTTLCRLLPPITSQLLTQQMELVPPTTDR